jgi:hypothetical protein
VVGGSCGSVPMRIVGVSARALAGRGGRTRGPENGGVEMLASHLRSADQRLRAIKGAPKSNRAGGKRCRGSTEQECSGSGLDERQEQVSGHPSDPRSGNLMVSPSTSTVERRSGFRRVLIAAGGAYSGSQMRRRSDQDNRQGLVFSWDGVA